MFITKYARVSVTQIPVILALIFLTAQLQAADSRDQDPYQLKVLKKIDHIQPTSEQMEAFRANLREYYSERNGSVRRVARSGGDLPIRVRRDLARVARQSVKSMSEVLNDQQLEHYEELVQIANEQYIFKSGLLEK